MPYRMLEELQNRKNEKVAMFLTFENVVGLIAFAFPFFIASGSLPFLIRMPVVIGAAALGVIVTLEINGMALYEQVLWRIRGLIRTRMRGRIISPTMLVGLPANEKDTDPVLPVDGPVQIANRVRTRGTKTVKITTIVPVRRQQQPEYHINGADDADVSL